VQLRERKKERERGRGMEGRDDGERTDTRVHCLKTGDLSIVLD
jgi:hypothetical protein